MIWFWADTYSIPFFRITSNFSSKYKLSCYLLNPWTKPFNRLRKKCNKILHSFEWWRHIWVNWIFQWDGVSGVEYFEAVRRQTSNWLSDYLPVASSTPVKSIPKHKLHWKTLFVHCFLLYITMYFSFFFLILSRVS